MLIGEGKVRQKVEMLREGCEVVERVKEWLKQEVKCGKSLA